MSTWRFLFRLLGFRSGIFVLAALSLVALETLNLAPPLIMQTFFDTLTKHVQAQLNIWTLLALWVAVVLAQIVTLFAFSWSSVVGENTIYVLIRSNLLEQILQHPAARALYCSPGEALSRFQGDLETITFFLILGYNVLGEFVLACAALVIMFSINAHITLVVIFPLVSVVLIVNLASKRLERYRVASREAAGQVSSALGEMFGAIGAIKVAAAETHIINHFRSLNATRRRAALTERFFTEALGSIHQQIGNIGTGIILLLVAQAMRSGTFTVGNLALFTYFLSYVTVFSGVLGRTLAQYRQLGVSLQRLSELLQGKPTALLVKHRPLSLRGSLPELPLVPQDAGEHLSLLEVSHLSYHHPTGECSIEDVTMHVKRGSLTVITGRVGAGKTTLLRSLLGLLPRESGEIRWNGTIIDDPAAWFVPPHCAYMPQIPHLFSETLRDNILLGIPENAANLAQAMQAAVLERDIEQLEHGLATMVGSRGVKLSGGQIQRAAAARMFVRAPELLVIDDLSSALDVETERLLWQRLLAREDRTLLVVSHRHAVLRQADHVIVLQDGHIVGQGKLDELLETWGPDIISPINSAKGEPTGM